VLELFPDSARLDGRDLVLGGVTASALADELGTPLVVYCEETLRERARALRQAADGGHVAFGTKAFANVAVMRVLREEGIGADVASAGELALTRRDGIDAGRVVMTGPGKRDDELEAAIGTGIRAITVESPTELSRIAAIAARLGRIQPVLLRAAVSERARLERVRLVGDDGAGKFGMDGGDLVIAARFAMASPHLALLGLHAFGASNVLDAGDLIDHIAATVRLARRLALSVGTTLRLVDAGGGLGIPYEPHEESLDLVGLGRGLAAITTAWGRDPVLRDARLLLEPGRFLVGPAGAYLATVVDRKTVAGEPVVILDGGVHHFLRPALVGQEHRIRAYPGRAGTADDLPSVGPGRMTAVTVAGPLCSGLDVFSQAAVMVPPEVGDLVAVLDAGAYGFTESMPFFLSHPIPAEVAVRGGRATVIRPRLDPAEWLERQVDPGW
jgi:diaminopimelate decarboxylase